MDYPLLAHDYGGVMGWQPSQTCSQRCYSALPKLVRPTLIAHAKPVVMGNMDRTKVPRSLVIVERYLLLW